MIDSKITITVVEIRGDKVRLGIVAPRDVPVHRQEVYEAIHGDDHPKDGGESPEDNGQSEIDIDHPDDEPTSDDNGRPL